MPCSYLVRAMGKFALLRYLSEFRFRVLTEITSDYPRFTHETQNHSGLAVDQVETESVVHYESQH